MLMDDKPNLTDELLIHFGVKGMKWGVRRKRPDEAQRKKFFSDRNKKILAGTAVALTGAAAVVFVLGSRGNAKVPSAEQLQSFSAKRQTVKNASGGAGKLVTPSFLPQNSPFKMRAEAGMAAHRNAMARIGNQRLTEKTWRDSAKLNTMVKNMNLKPGENRYVIPLEEIRRRMSDPNYVWEL